VPFQAVYLLKNAFWDNQRVFNLSTFIRYGMFRL
jgi:hypothetical protein